MNTPPSHHAPRSAREYSAMVLAEPDLQRRRSLMERCPQVWLSLVTDYVTEGYARIQAYRRYISGRRQSMQEGPQPAPRRDDTSFRISDFKKSAPEVGNRELAKLKALVGGGNGD